MDRRTLLAAVAATAFSTAALTGAVAATTHVFAAGEAAAGVGTISPVSTTTLPPIVEHRIIDVEDPAPVATPAPTPTARPTRPVREERTEATPAAPVATVSAAPTPAPAPAAEHHEDHEDYEPGDD